MTPLHTTFRLVAAAAALLWFTWIASAQTDPKMVYNMAYATIDESTLYIHGGFDGTNSSYTTRFNQFYSLDLKRSWNTSDPPWTEITVVGGAPGRLTTAGHTMSISQNRISNGYLRDVVTVWDMVNPLTFAASYYFESQSWQELPALPPPEPGPLRFYQAATHPETGRVYIPGCAGTSMLGYDSSTSTASVLPMPYLGNITSWNGYSFVWNGVRKSFFLFGGVGAPSESSYLYEYRTSSTPPSWEFLRSYGSIPPHLSEMCMTSASNGNKMLVFGGGFNGSEVGTLYILDVPTMTWTRGPSSQPRKGMACTVAGNNFVVWGGISWNNSGVFVPLPSTPIVYNINTGQWTTQFTVTSRAVPENEPGPEGSDGEAGKIIGIVAGVVVAVAVLIVITRNLWKHSVHRALQNQQRRKHGQEQGKGKDLEDKGTSLVSSDQKLEEITEDGYFGNAGPSPNASGSPLHWPATLPPPPLVSPAYPSPPLPSHLPPCAIAAPHITDIFGDPLDIHQKEPRPQHNPQLFTDNTDSSYNIPEQTPCSPQGQGEPTTSSSLRQGTKWSRSTDRSMV
ncbi:hypothetical protein BG015_005870 [Linnemannia schmuckeri]|uniref:Kelch repeat protein n=1 Tax=Linnemannia schmuckeri TaxID=64567 RepID=A0A9P5S3Y2_9FUNG|nr:hypothetical protein BG015_005870 [Linnemannia schmuckeri]